MNRLRLKIMAVIVPVSFISFFLMFYFNAYYVVKEEAALTRGLWSSIGVVALLVGIVSHSAVDAGYVLVIPLGGIIFYAAGRHPLAGIAAAFAGVSGGYSANLLLGTVDPLLAGLSQEAARIVDPSYVVNPACNFYFMAVSTILIAGAGTLVTEKLVEPREESQTGARYHEDV